MLVSRARIALLLALVAFLVHARSIGFGFSPLDDRLLILDRLGWLAQPEHLLDAFREGVFLGKERNYYRPLLTVSFMPDTWLGGGAPWAYHLTNVLLHVAGTLLAFRCLEALGAARGAAAALALLFAAHPLSAHAVAWIPGRNDTLLAVWILAALACFDRALAGRVWWSVAHAACLLLALLTKETAVLLPPLLVLRAWLSGARRPGRSAALGVGLGWAAAIAVWAGLRGAYGGPGLETPPHLAAGVVVEFARALLVLYGKLLFPFALSVTPVTVDSSPLPGVVAVLITLAAAAGLGFRDRGVAWFGLAWLVAFLILPTLVGSTGMVMPIHHEHRLYLPAVGFLAAIAQLRFERLAWVTPRRLGALALALAALLGLRTVVRSGVYADPLSFSEDAVRHAGNFALSWRLRGDVRLDRGEIDAAIADLERCLALRPGYPGALSNLAKAHYLAGRPERAIELYSQAIAGEPREIEYYNNRGLVYLMSGHAPQAIADLDVVLARDRYNWRALNNRGKALAEVGRYAEAVADLTTAIEARPDDGEAHHNRAVAFYYLRDYERAWADVEAARRLGIPITPEFLAALEQASGRRTEPSPAPALP